MMSRATPPCGGGEGGAGKSSPSGSPKTPRGGALSERVNFFEQMWSRGSRSASMDDLQRDEIDGQRRRSASNLTMNIPRSSSRASNSSFEESFERLVEEGELNGAKVEGFNLGFLTFFKGHNLGYLF